MNDPAPNVAWTNRVSGNSNPNDPRPIREITRVQAHKDPVNERIRGVSIRFKKTFKPTLGMMFVAVSILGAQGCAGLSKWNDLKPPIASADANEEGDATASTDTDAQVKRTASAVMESPIYASPPIAVETPAAMASPIYASPPIAFDAAAASESKTKVDTQDTKTSSNEKSKRSNSVAQSGSTTHDRSLKSNRVDRKGVKDVAKSASKAGAKDDPKLKKTQTRGESNRVVSPEDSDSTSPPDDVDPFLFPRLKKLIREDETEKRPDPKVNIRHPDPDTANFPNSAFTVPKGRVYIESSPLGLTGPVQGSKNSSYNWNYLIRYGLTDNLELRFFGNGLTAISGKNGTTGFAPLDFDFKVHFWNENRKFFIPAAGLEVYLQTNFGSPALDSGVQPSINMLFDQTLPFEVNLEWNIGITGNRSRGNIFYEFSTQWSFEHKIIKDLDVFVQGYYNAASLPRFVGLNFVQRNAIVNGIGLIRTVNDQFAIFGSYNIGFTRTSPNHIILLGFAVAF